MKQVVRKSKPTATPRRTQAERRAGTQQSILTAALETLVEFGHAGFTTTRIAAKAGVSRGAQENYFPTRTALLAAATAHAMDEAAARATETAARASHSADPLKAFLDEEGAFFFSVTYAAMVELALAGRSDPALRKIHRDAFDTIGRSRDRAWTQALIAAGYDATRVRDLLTMTVTVFRGVALSAVILPPQAGAKRAAALWREQAAPLLGPRRKK